MMALPITDEGLFMFLSLILGRMRENLTTVSSPRVYSMEVKYFTHYCFTDLKIT